MRDAEIEALIEASIARQNAGDLPAAEAGYRQVLDLAPANGEVLQLLGGLKLQEGALEAAKTYLLQAVKIVPRDPIVRINLAALYVKMGDVLSAHQHALAAADLAPDHPIAWRQLAVTAEKTGNTATAIEALQKLLHWETNNGRIRIKLAELLSQKGFSKSVADLLEQILCLHKNHEADLLSAADIAQRFRQWHLMIRICERWLRDFPDSQVAREKLSQAYLEAGNIPASLTTFKPLLQRANVSPDQHLTYGRICLIAQDFEAAEENLSYAVRALDKSAEAAFAMARLLTFKGELGAAEKECLRCIALNPDYIPAYVQLTTLRSGDIEDAHLEKMQELWVNSSLPKEVLSSLAFSIGDTFNRRAMPKQAFHYYHQANEANYAVYAQEGAVFDAKRHQMEIEILINDSMQGKKIISQKQVMTLRPIFVIGMPRSGTTLVESILAAHSKICGCGELLVGSQIYDEYKRIKRHAPQRSIDTILAQNASGWRKRFEEKFHKARGCRYAVDKLPLNFLSLSILMQLYPQAQFIHVQRDALDTCFSIYRHSFPRAYDFSHRLQDIGQYYRQYERLMRHWQEIYSDQIITIRYETLVDDPEANIRRLIESVGLQWEEACMNFHEVKRPVATFSSVQVRQPISKASIGVAQRYQDHLEPLKAALARVETQS